MGKLYTCFIDFRKAFDIVERNILFYKLRQIGISGNFYNIIKDVYTTVATAFFMSTETHAKRLLTVWKRSVCITKTCLYNFDLLEPHFYIVKLGGSNETHNLCFEQKYERNIRFLSKKFLFLEVKISIYLNRRVFAMTTLKRSFTVLANQIIVS